MSGPDLKSLRARVERFGGQWTDAPTLQPLGLLLDLAGEAVRSRLLVVSGGAEEMALRPDFTIPVTRAHIASGAPSGRYLYEGTAYRAPAGAGDGESEFLQLGAEAFGGEGDPALEDAEVIGLAADAAAGGGRDDLRLILGDVALFKSFLEAIGVSDVARARLLEVFANPPALRAVLRRAASGEAARADGGLAALLSDLPEAEGAQVLEELWAVAGIQPVGGRSAAEIVHRLALRASSERSGGLDAREAGLIEAFLAVSGPPLEAIGTVERIAAAAGGDLSFASGAWMRRVTALEQTSAAGMKMVFAAAFARPFGYYDGFLFEIRSEALGEAAPLAAGGRYDALPARLGGRPGAVGCMIRPARVGVGTMGGAG